MDNNRNHSLDIAKGIGILLVIWGHIFRGSSFLNILKLGSTFHMPLFFFISGIALYYSHNKTNLWHKIKPLIITYFLFSVLLYLYWLFIEFSSRPIHLMPAFTALGITDARVQQAVNLVLAFDFEGAFTYNVVMWFLPCIIGAQALYLTVLRYLKPLQQHILLLIVCPAIYLALHSICNVRLPWCFELSLIAVPYLHLGYSIFQHDTIRQGLQSYRWVLFSAGLILLVSLYNLGIRSTGYYNQITPLWWHFYLLPLCGIVCIMGLSYILKSNRLLQFLGYNSLILMILHEPIKRLVIKVSSILLHQDTNVIRENTLYCLLITLVILIICTPLIIFINRKARFLLGKS